MKHKTNLLLCLMLLACASSCTYETYYERLDRESREYTEFKCPSRIDEFTIMDSMLFSHTDTSITYTFTVTGTLDNDSVYTPEIVEDFRTKLLSNLKGRVDNQTLKSHGVRFRYIYNSATTGKKYLELNFDNSDYN